MELRRSTTPASPTSVGAPQMLRHCPQLRRRWMYRAYARLFIFVLTGCLPLALANSQTPLPRVQYPVTRRADHVDTYGTVKVADPYRWLEAIDSTSVTDWVRAENA